MKTPRILRPGHLALYLSALLLISAWFCYALQSDRFAAVTIWPAWSWMVPGMAFLALSRRSTSRTARWLIVFAWLAYVAFIPEEPSSLIRALVPEISAHSLISNWRTVRVVSLNCAAGSSEAAEEVISRKPDIVLLQESPDRKTISALARKLFGEQGAAVYGVDASIIARGKMKVLAIPKEDGMICTAAVADLDSKCRVQVISARLIPPVACFDLWSPDCWRVNTENRRARREQVVSLIRQINRFDNNIPVIVGGDMNAPGGDGALGDMRRNLRDSFYEGGRGWCNTVINDIPVQRIDQVWINDSCRAVSVTAKKTINSDHRIVVCDLLVREK